MRLPERTNGALRRTLRIEVVRARTIDELRQRAGRADKRAAKARARNKVLQERLRDARKQARSHRVKHDKLLKYVKRQIWDLPPDYHPDMRSIWPRVRHRTMLDHMKLNYLLDAVRYVSTSGIEGDIVECGVWRGGAMLGCALTLDNLGDHGRDLYLYDTYEGMPEPTERDVHLWHGRTAVQELEKRTNKSAPIWEPGLIEDVQSAFDETDYPREKLHFIKGKVEETIPSTAPERIAVLRLDTDWYESTRHELEHLYPRLVPGGILIIDDYGSWQGSRDATAEYFSEPPEPIFMVRTSKGRAGVRPGLYAPADPPPAPETSTPESHG